MTKMRIMVLLLVLLLAGSVASATTQYPLASVDIEDEINVQSVTNARFTTANDNAISLLEVSVPNPLGVTTLNITTQDHKIVYTKTKTKTGILDQTLIRNIKVYKNNVLISNISNTQADWSFMIDSKDVLIVKKGFVSVKYGPHYTMQGKISNFSTQTGLLPNHEVTVSSLSSSADVWLRVTAVSELQRTAIEDDLNSLFGFLYWSLTLIYDDADGDLLSFLYIFSFSMDAILWIIWISITSTFSVFAYIESAITFYAGWRNNKIKGFFDDLLSWHFIIITALAGAIYKLFVVVYDFIKSVVPGIG